MLTEDQLREAFPLVCNHMMPGSARIFTRRMAIHLADLSDCDVKTIIRRLEKLALLKQGSWEWFQNNGGFTKTHYEQARKESRAKATRVEPGNAGGTVTVR